MNRRKLLGLMAVTPISGKIANFPEVPAAPMVEASPPQFILGQILDTVETAVDYYRNASPTTDTRIVRKIWDGEKFVFLDSREGGEVINRVLAQGLSNKTDC